MGIHMWELRKDRFKEVSYINVSPVHIPRANTSFSQLMSVGQFPVEQNRVRSVPRWARPHPNLRLAAVRPYLRDGHQIAARHLRRGHLDGGQPHRRRAAARVLLARQRGRRPHGLGSRATRHAVPHWLDAIHPQSHLGPSRGRPAHPDDLVAAASTSTEAYVSRCPCGRVTV